MSQNVIRDKNELWACSSQAVPINSPLPYTIYVLVNDVFVLFRAKGDILDKDRVKSLLEKNVRTVHILKADWKEHLDALIVEKTWADEARSNSKTFAIKMHQHLFGFGKLLEEKTNINSKNLEQVKALSDTLAIAIDRDVSLCTKLIKKTTDAQLYHTNHPINVAVYAAAIGKKMGYGVTELSELILGGFLHNIGMVEMPHALIYKSAPLTKEEWNVIKEHPKLGVQLLEGEGIILPPAITRMISEHHEREDGSGYHRGITSERIHPFSKIISIADVYDALTSERPWEHAYIPELAVELMINMKGQLDQKIFKGGFLKKVA